MAKKWIVSIIAIVLIILLFVSSNLSLEENEDVKINKDQYICWIGIQKIGQALYQYAIEHNNKFPEKLEDLIEQKYLLDKNILQCHGHSYHYTKGLSLDMPFNIPILIETECPHIYKRFGKPYRCGFALLLDFSYKLFPKEDISFWLQETEEAMKLINQNDQNKLLSYLKIPIVHECTKSMSLWKLRQLHAPITTEIKECLQNRAFAVRHQAALCIAFYDKKIALPVLQESMLSMNYCIRKSVSPYFFKDNDIRKFSPTLAAKIAFSVK